MAVVAAAAGGLGPVVGLVLLSRNTSLHNLLVVDVAPEGAVAWGFGDRPRPRRLLATEPAEESAEVAEVRLPLRDAGRPRWGESNARSWCCTSASVGGVAQLRAASTRRAMVTHSATGDASAGCSNRVKVTFLAFFFLGCGGSPPKGRDFCS